MLSILIVNWNTREHLRACLNSLAAHPSSEAQEVVVVDNASTDGSVDMVRSEFPWAKLLASPKNSGYAVGNNLAFASASGEWLLTLNPDTELVDDSLDRAIATMRSNPRAGCLGVKLVSPDGTVQSSVRGFPTLLGLLGDAFGLGKHFGGIMDSYRLRSFNYELEQLAPQPMGTFLLFRRSALESVGDPTRPFDEAFPIFFNEVDLLYRLRIAGWDCIYTPSAKVLHHGGESTKQVRKSMIWESHKSLVRYLRKHRGTGIARLGLPFVTALIYGAAMVRAKGYDAGFSA